MAASKFDYLRHRPFLIIEIYHLPRSGVRTERKGWASDSTLQTLEHPYLRERISDSVMRRATVIIDITFDTVIKNSLRSGVADDELLKQCKRKHSSLFATARARYA